MVVKRLLVGTVLSIELESANRKRRGNVDPAGAIYATVLALALSNGGLALGYKIL